MYVGHYALGIGLASIKPAPRALTYMAAAAIAPDVPGLLLAALGVDPTLSHARSGLVVMALLASVIGYVLRVGLLRMALAACAVLLHRPGDAYAQWLYTHRWIDLALEGSLLLLAAMAYGRRYGLEGRLRTRWWFVSGAVLSLQLVWDGVLLAGSSW